MNEIVKEMDMGEKLAYMNSGRASSEEIGAIVQEMRAATQESMRITARLNGEYHTPCEIRELFSQIIGETVPDDFTLFPPFTTDYGKNIHVGKNVFVNSGCRFQDQGGIYIDDDVLIGHNVVIATLNHEIAPARRAALVPAPVHIGKRVWIGSNSTILPGVSIGDNSVVAAGATVTKSVPENCIVGGTPAKLIRELTGEELAAE